MTVHVVTVDPMLSVDGAERLPEPEETTASRIRAAGGSARASSASVTDADAVRSLFDELAASHGGIDAVVNVAGISRPTGFATGMEQDWADVVDVHLNGYLNVLTAALAHMASAGRGRILGVTSGSGWRAADTGAYGCAKRAVASLTWQLGAAPPSGVAVNALSPIAATRMVVATPRLRQHHLRRPGGPGMGGPCASRDRHTDLACPSGAGGPPMTARPARIIDAHVHLWDPARTDWYPYLSGGQELDMGDVTGMSRRFDVAAHRAESDGWNVEAIVTVAAATGAHSVDETLELDAAADGSGGPDAIVDGLPPADTWPKP